MYIFLLYFNHTPFYSPRPHDQDSNGDPILDRSRYQLVNRRQGDAATPKYGPE